MKKRRKKISKSNKQINPSLKQNELQKNEKQFVDNQTYKSQKVMWSTWKKSCVRPITKTNHFLIKPLH